MAEALLQAVLELLYRRKERRSAGCRTAGWFGNSIARKMVGHEFFRSANRQAAPDNVFREEQLFFLRLEREEHFGVADRDPGLGQITLYLLVKIEKAHAVCDRRPALSDLLRDIFLTEMEFSREPGKSARFLDRIEVFALQVLDECEFEDVLVGGFANDHRRLLQSDPLRGAPAAFSGNELEFVAAFAGNQRLNNSVFADRVDKLLQNVVAKVGPRLKWSGDDLMNRDALDPLPAFDDRRW